MTYKRCCACDFWVTMMDKRCPNCGIREPRVDRVDALPAETPMTDGTRAAFGGFVGAVVGGMLLGGMGVAVGVAIGVSVGVLLGPDSEGLADQPALAGVVGAVAGRPTASLRQDEQVIQQRLSDIAAREKRLGEARQRVDLEGGTDRWQTVRQTLDSAGAILARQRERYHAKLWEIALVRWQNTLEPLTADWDTLTHEECNRRLQALGVQRERGLGFLQDWEGVDLTHLPEGQSCITRLKNALTSCEQLRQALVVQQAALAVKGIAPMHESLAKHAPSASDPLKQLDVFNARAAIGEFSTAFGELEAEYARLRSEEELAENSVLVQRIR